MKPSINSISLINFFFPIVKILLSKSRKERVKHHSCHSAMPHSIRPRYESSIDTFQFPLGTCQARDDPRIINPSFRCAQERGREGGGWRPFRRAIRLQHTRQTREIKSTVSVIRSASRTPPPLLPPRYNITQSRHVRRPKRIGLRARTETAKIPGSLDR